MRSVRKLSLAILAVVALAALASATSASASTWTINSVEAKEAANVAGHATIDFTEIVGGTRMRFACELTDKGVVGPGYHGEITSVAGSTGKTPIVCKIVNGARNCTTSAEVTPERLPWATELVKLPNGNFYVGWMGYWKINCTSGSGKFSEECHGGEVPRAEQFGTEVLLNFERQPAPYELACQTNPIKLEGSEYIGLTSAQTLSFK